MTTGSGKQPEVDMTAEGLDFRIRKSRDTYHIAYLFCKEALEHYAKGPANAVANEALAKAWRLFQPGEYFP